MHRWILVLAVSISTLAVMVGNAAEKSKMQPGVMLTVEKKAHSRVQYYIVNTPVSTEEPYFEAEIDSAGFVYTADYEPRHAEEELPDGCLPGRPGAARAGKRRGAATQGTGAAR